MIHKNLIKDKYSFKIKASLIRNWEQTLNIEITVKYHLLYLILFPLKSETKGESFLNKKKGGHTGDFYRAGEHTILL